MVVHHFCRSGVGHGHERYMAKDLQDILLSGLYFSISSNGRFCSAPVLPDEIGLAIQSFATSLVPLLEAMPQPLLATRGSGAHGSHGAALCSYHWPSCPQLWASRVHGQTRRPRVPSSRRHNRGSNVHRGPFTRLLRSRRLIWWAATAPQTVVSQCC